MSDAAAPILDPLVERYLRGLRIESGLSINTIESYRRDLAKFQQYLAHHRFRMTDTVGPPMVVAFLASLRTQPLAASSIARILSAMRGWFRFLVRERLVESNPLPDVMASRRAVRLPKTLTMSEVTQLLDLPAGSSA